MDEVMDQNKPVSHPLSLMCPWRIRAGQQAAVRTWAARGGGGPAPARVWR
jgi:hypothetical protein